MPTYNVSATVSSPPTDVSLKVNSSAVKMARDVTGGWSGKAKLDLPDNCPIAFRAVGIAQAPWSLEIKFTKLPLPGKLVLDYKHADTIPDSLLSVFEDTVNLAAKVTP